MRWCLALLFAITASSLATAQELVVVNTVVDADSIRASEQALAAAVSTRDQRRLDELLAQDFVLRGEPDLDRATWIRNALTLCWGDRSDTDAFQVRTYEATAIASFILTTYSHPTTCRPAVVRSLITDVWEHQPDGWRLHLRHAGAPPDAGAGVTAQFGLAPIPPAVWEVSGEWSLVATAGNTSTRTLGINGNAVHRTTRTTTRTTAAFLTSEADTITNARSLSLEFRHGIRIRPRMEVFGQGAFARDRFAGIGDRIATGAGLSYTAAVRRPHALALDIGLGFTSERRLDLTTERFATATGGFNYKWTPRPGTELTEVANVVGDLQTAANWRTINTAAIIVSLTRRLSLKVSQAVEYRHQPVVGFGRIDVRSAAAFIVSLQSRERTGAR